MKSEIRLSQASWPELGLSKEAGKQVSKRANEQVSKWTLLQVLEFQGSRMVINDCIFCLPCTNVCVTAEIYQYMHSSLTDSCHFFVVWTLLNWEKLSLKFGVKTSRTTHPKTLQVGLDTKITLNTTPPPTTTGTQLSAIDQYRVQSHVNYWYLWQLPYKFSCNYLRGGIKIQNRENLGTCPKV